MQQLTKDLNSPIETVTVILYARTGQKFCFWIDFRRVLRTSRKMVSYYCTLLVENRSGVVEQQTRENISFGSLFCLVVESTIDLEYCEV